VATSPELRRQLGQAGRQRVLDHYTNERLAQQLFEFFCKLL